MSAVGVVVIGRNEGSKLRECLLSAISPERKVVYVDSGSTDNSVDLANSLNVNVVELDLSVPFTAARARNQGFKHLLTINPNIEFVQFVDGDCYICPEWWSRAIGEFYAEPDTVVVCGRRKERFPEKSLYNLLCDIEWNTPVGQAKACGGDAMMRVSALEKVGGFNPRLIAGEEPELCLRLRQSGGKILRIDSPMTVHDAQMNKFSQWWKRSQRAGHAYAEGAFLHGKSPEKHWVKESRSIWLWGVTFPSIALIFALISHGISVFALAFLYLILWYKTFKFYQTQELSSSHAACYSLFCVLAKFPQVQGQIDFHLRRLLHKQSTLIEYKEIMN